MKRSLFSSARMIQLFVWALCYLSLVSLVYHIRWYVPFLQRGAQFLVPSDQNPAIWFPAQILMNATYLFASVCLALFIRSYQRLGYLNLSSCRLIHGIIFSCLLLGMVGVVKTVVNNFEMIHWQDWAGVEAVLNLMLKSVVDLFFLKEPQTMYVLVGIALWVISQYVTRAVGYKEDSEAVI